MRLLVLKLCVCPALGDTMNSLQMWKYQLTLLSVLRVSVALYPCQHLTFSFSMWVTEFDTVVLTYISMIN